MDGPYHFSGWGGSGHEYGEASGGGGGGGGGCFGRPSTSDSDFLSEFLDPLSPDLSPHVTTSRGAILQAHVSRMHHDDGGGSGGGGGSGSVRVNNDDEVESSRTKDGHDGKQQPDTSKMGASGSFDSRHKRKRNRTTEMHNMTERRRRDKIKVKLKALQELIPNGHKLDRAALLDEIIAYVKSLQMQVQMMQCGGICHSPYMTHSPCLHMPHMPRISPFSHMAMSYGMGMGSMACPVPPPMMSIPAPHPPTTFVPMTRYDTISAICPLSQPVLYAPMTTSIPSPPVLQSGPFTSHRGSTTVTQEEATKENPSLCEPISTTG